MMYYSSMLGMLSVFIGGGIGALLRYLICSHYSKACSLTFPYHTFFINIIGSFILGFLIYIFNVKTGFHNNVKLFLTVGFCGGLTTFSTFSVESIELLKNGHYLHFFAYTFGSVFVCLIFAAIGVYIARFF